MTKISGAARKHYMKKVRDYRQVVDQLTRREQEVLVLIAKGGPDAVFKKLAVANDELNLISYLLIMDRLSRLVLGIKGEETLNAARKICYKVITFLEEVYTSFVDVSPSEYEEGLRKVSDSPEGERYGLIRKLGFAVDSVRDAFGSNSKWKWAFVDMEGRVAIVAKNCIYLKEFVPGMDPRAKGYVMRGHYFALVKDLIVRAADGLRSKYELSTHRLTDFQLGISYLRALRRLMILVGKQQDLVALNKKISIWSRKMEMDMAKAEEQRAKKK